MYAFLLSILLFSSLHLNDLIFTLKKQPLEPLLPSHQSQALGYETKNFKHHDLRFNLFMVPEGKQFGIKYFSQNAASRFERWRQDKKVLIACAGAFSATWDSDSHPVGFTIDNGEVINLNFDVEMDGLVIVEDNEVKVLDLDYLQSGIEIDGGKIIRLNPRNSTYDSELLRNLAVRNKFTIFQTQLLFSKSRANNFTNLYFGKIRERRFMALCMKNSIFYNVIIDVPDPAYLNLAAKYAKEVLEYDGFSVSMILNLDTGDKNIFWGTEKEILYDFGSIKMDKSTNLIVWYQ
jgi:hypothetical protein